MSYHTWFLRCDVAGKEPVAAARASRVLGARRGVGLHGTGRADGAVRVGWEYALAGALGERLRVLVLVGPQNIWHVNAAIAPAPPIPQPTHQHNRHWSLARGYRTSPNARLLHVEIIDMRPLIGRHQPHTRVSRPHRGAWVSWNRQKLQLNSAVLLAHGALTRIHKLRECLHTLHARTLTCGACS